jgi:8-oxo-dGTP diphosphatase
MVLIDDLLGRVAVHGLVYNPEGKILLLKRSELDKDEANCWDPPGGGIERGESVEKGFIRELMEEAGIIASEVQAFGAHEVDDGSCGIFVRAKTNSTDIRISNEHNDYKWVTEEELLSLKPASLHLRAIQTLLKSKKRVINFKDTPDE